ncbi:MAG TPA: 50S ribosomal protein L32 [Dehalococcoidia bacterium]|nr:50S ribosomal protein L32 [Dehalococcoidia bacterium]
MGALPKRKTAKARKNKRRSHHAWSEPTLVECPQCHSPKLPHRVCPTCGSYAGRDVIEIKSPRPRTT